jgi:hypothetical protein
VEDWKMGDCVKLARLGERWTGDPEKDTCEACTSLRGQEFYYEPQDGQQSISDMPKQPLHPNCRCGTEYIYECAPREDARPDCVKLNFTNPKLSENFFTNTVYALGLVWRDGEEYKGPIYGNHGGGEWCNGDKWENIMGAAIASAEEEKVECTDDYKYMHYINNLRPAIDDLDEAFMKHDIGYTKIELKQKDGQRTVDYDEELLSEVERLRRDAQENDWQGWTNPPKNEDEKAYALRYMDVAVSTFKTRINDHYNSQHSPHERSKQAIYFMIRRH